MRLLSFIAGAGMGAFLALAGGCDAPAVDRAAELQRFKATIRERTGALALTPGEVLTSPRCEDIAQQNNLELAVRRLALRLQDDQVRMALSTGLPHANAGYLYSRRSNPALMGFGDQEISMEDRTQESFALTATVPVLDFGVTYYAWQIARDQRTQQQMLLERARQELRRDVRIAYARHAGALRQEKLAQVNVMAADRVLKVGETMAREALVTQAEVAILRAAMAQAQVELAVVQRKVAETRLELMKLMALPPDVTIAIDEKRPPLPEPPAGEVLAGLEEHALLVRPELRVQDLQRHISANNVRREVAAFFPHLDANGAFNWTSNSLMLNPTFFLYGFSVADSLLDGGVQLWRYGLADKTRTIEEERTLLLSLGILYDVDLRALRLQRDRQTIQALEANEQARQKALEEILSLYREGLETEAGTARALAELNRQTLGVDIAQTDYLETWYEFQAATLPEVPPPTVPAAPPALPTTMPAAGGPAFSAATPPATPTTPASTPEKVSPQ
jgi:outer membrane protein TolC